MGMGAKVAIALLTVGCATVFAAEVLKPAEQKDFLKDSRLSFADGVFSCKGNYAILMSAEIFPVDPSKKYRISGKFRAKPGTEPAVLYFGYVPHDGKNAAIASASVNWFPNTETQLAEPAKAGETVLKVKDASKWNMKANHGVVAFNVKPDFSDLPNSDIADAVPGKIENKGDVWEITLKAPLKKAYEKGTAVRQQTHGGTYIYNGAAGRKTSDDWQTFSGVISGHAKSGNTAAQWWPGTKAARILIGANYGAKGKFETEFKDIVVETVD